MSREISPEPEPAPALLDGSDDDPLLLQRTGSTGAGPRGRILRQAGKGIALTLAVAVFVSVGVAWGAKRLLDTQIRHVSALDPTASSIVDAAGQAGDENFLLVGTDTAQTTAPPTGPAPAASAATAPAATAPAGAGSDQAETIMVTHIAADRRSAITVAFPLDLVVNRPSCQRWDEASASYRDEVAPTDSSGTLASAFEVGGPRCVTKVVQQLSGLAITRFISLDLKGFAEMSDAVAGVPVCLAQPVVDSELGAVVPAAGSSTLTGRRALDFVRASHVRGDSSGDEGRTARQQILLAALLRKAMSNQVLLDPTMLQAFIGAFAANSLSDSAGVDDLLTLARSLQPTDSSKVGFVTVPTAPEADAHGNHVLDDAGSRGFFQAIRNDTQVPPAGGQSGAASADPGAQPSAPAGSLGTVKLKVLNASGRSGLAGQIGETLGKLGFSVTGVGTAAASQQTVIRYSGDLAPQARMLAAAVPAATLQQDSTGAGDLSLVLGAGFDGMIAPAAPTPTASSSPAVGAGTASCG